jgi:hypothetical protein
MSPENAVTLCIATAIDRLRTSGVNFYPDTLLRHRWRGYVQGLIDILDNNVVRVFDPHA